MDQQLTPPATEPERLQRISARLHEHLRGLAIAYPEIEEIAARVAGGDPVAREGLADLSAAIARFLVALSAPPERVH